MRLVFCGTGEIGLPSFRALCASTHEVVGVVTQPDRPAGRDLKPRVSVIKSEALKNGLPIFQPERIRAPESVESLRSLAPDVMVVVAYGQILPASVLQIPQLGCLNVHTSILPRHRGASPIQTAILSGDEETGVTIMFMDEGLDTGDVLWVERTPIGARETAGELHDRLAELAPGPLLRALSLVELGKAPRVAQDTGLATLSRKLKKTDGLLDWSDSACRLDFRVRAMTPWPGAWTKFAVSGENLKIHRARVAEGEGMPGTILATTADGIRVATGVQCLVLEEVQLDGRRRLSVADFLRGRPMAVGESFG